MKRRFGFVIGACMIIGMIDLVTEKVVFATIYNPLDPSEEIVPTDPPEEIPEKVEEPPTEMEESKEQPAPEPEKRAGAILTVRKQFFGKAKTFCPTSHAGGCLCAGSFERRSSTARK